MHVRFPQPHLPGEQPLLRYLRLPWSLPYRNLPERFPVYLQELLLQEVLLRQRSVQRVLLPGSVPLIISNMKVNIGLCLVGVIIGEFLAANKGLGYLIIYGSQVFKMDLVVMSIVILCFVSAVLYQGISLLEKKIGHN